MALWGATAGVATLVGPILGGVLVDGARLGVDLLHQRAGRDLRPGPRGAAGADAGDPHPPVRLARASRSAASACSCWSSGSRRATSTTGPPTIWAMIVVGLGGPRPVRPVAGAQHGRSRWCRSACSATATSRWPTSTISVMGFAITALAIPLMLWAQVVRGLSPTRSALLLVPMAIMTILLARPVGNLTDRVHPRMITGVRVRGHDRLAGVAVPRDDARRVHRGADRPDGAARHRQRVHLGAQLRDRDPQPPDPAGRRRRRRLQRHPSGRRRARLGRHRRAHRRAARGRGAAGVRGHAARPAASCRRRSPTAFSQAMATAMLLPAAVLVLGLVASLLFERPRHEGYAGAPGAAASAAASADAGSAPPASAG